MRHTTPFLGPTLALVICIAGPSSANADIAVYSCQAPKTGPVVALTRDNACVGYRTTYPAGRKREVHFAFQGSGKLIASKDGRTVVMIQSYLYGRKTEAGGIVEFAGTREIRNPVAIYVYRDGKPIAAHRIHGLLASKRVVEQTISHVRWLRSAPDAISGRFFKLTLLSGDTLIFDTQSGTLVRRHSL